MKEWICTEGNIACGDNVPVGLCKIKELVRCQDCRYYIPRESVFSEEIQFFKCRILDIDTDPEWFCADGEKR